MVTKPPLGDEKRDFHVAALTERGRRTQRAIMDAALELLASGRSFNSLSMREVATLAGVVPSGFYRHFKDMNELGLAIVDDCGRSLRVELRRTRWGNSSPRDIFRSSFLVFRKYIEAHPQHFYIASGERHGGSPLLREAIRTEIGQFVDEMAHDIEAMKLLPNMSQDTLRNVCDLVVNTMLSAASEIIDWPKDDPQLRKTRSDAYIQQLRIIFLGADVWMDKTAESAVESVESGS